MRARRSALVARFQGPKADVIGSLSAKQGKVLKHQTPDLGATRAARGTTVSQNQLCRPHGGGVPLILHLDTRDHPQRGRLAAATTPDRQVYLCPGIYLSGCVFTGQARPP